MDTDLHFVIGIGVAVLAIPPIIGAFSDGRSPRGGAVMVLIGGGLMALAVSGKPGGYSIAEIPDVVVRVVARYIN